MTVVSEFANHQFNTHLQQQGILHQYSCPHSFEQNGSVECRHRIIQELGKTIFSHSGVPKRFSVKAFTTAIFLINRLPSTAIDLQFSVLYCHFPDYTSVRVFGSKCYTYAWDTKHNKFDLKTLPYIFIDSSDHHQGYQGTFISQHVIFDKCTFPFK